MDGGSAVDKGVGNRQRLLGPLGDEVLPLFVCFVGWKCIDALNHVILAKNVVLGLAHHGSLGWQLARAARLGCAVTVMVKVNCFLRVHREVVVDVVSRQISCQLLLDTRCLAEGVVVVGCRLFDGEEVLTRYFGDAAHFVESCALALVMLLGVETVLHPAQLFIGLPQELGE